MNYNKLNIPMEPHPGHEISKPLPCTFLNFSPLVTSTDHRLVLSIFALFYANIHILHGFFWSDFNQHYVCEMHWCYICSSSYLFSLLFSIQLYKSSLIYVSILLLTNIWVICRRILNFNLNYKFKFGLPNCREESLVNSTHFIQWFVGLIYTFNYLDIQCMGLYLYSFSESCKR